MSSNIESNRFDDKDTDLHQISHLIPSQTNCNCKFINFFWFQFFVGRMSDVFKAVLFKLGKYLPIRGVASAAAGNNSTKYFFEGKKPPKIFVEQPTTFY